MFELQKGQHMSERWRLPLDMRPNLGIQFAPKIMHVIKWPPNVLQAALCYDLAATKFRGKGAATNFDLSCFPEQVELLNTVRMLPGITETCSKRIRKEWFDCCKF
eukprot:scaffold257683_cov28-Tisochrysis_lutea.AAC.1